MVGVPLGSQMAIDQAIDQAWNAYEQGTLSFPSAFSQGNIAVSEGTNGLNMKLLLTVYKDKTELNIQLHQIRNINQ